MVDLFSNKEVLRTQPNPEDNGKIFVVAEIIPNLEPVKMSNVAVNPEAANMTFDKKNLIYGFSIIPESSSFNPSKNQLYWGADIKIPISKTETLVRHVSPLIDVLEITDYQEQDYKRYFGTGTISVGNSTWNTGGVFDIFNNQRLRQTIRKIIRLLVLGNVIENVCCFGAPFYIIVVRMGVFFYTFSYNLAH